VVPGSALRGNGMIFRASVDIKASRGYWPFEDGAAAPEQKNPVPSEEEKNRRRESKLKMQCSHRASKHNM
jgi:hypothetical protein